MAHIQILVNNQSVDVPTDLVLSFKFENSLFDFNLIPSQRTLEFELPLTPKNNNIFGLPNNFAYGGGTICQKLSCVLIVGYIPLTGQLVMNGVSDGELSCMFYVSTEKDTILYDNLKQLPKLNQCNIIPAWTTKWLASSPVPNTGIYRRFCLRGYETDMSHNVQNWNYMPSVVLRDLVDISLLGYGINVNWLQNTNYNQLDYADYAIVLDSHNQQKMNVISEIYVDTLGTNDYVRYNPSYVITYPATDTEPSVQVSTDVYITRKIGYYRIDASLYRPNTVIPQGYNNAGYTVKSSYIIVKGTGVDYAIKGDENANYIIKTSSAGSTVIAILYRFINHESQLEFSKLQDIANTTIQYIGDIDAIENGGEIPYNNSSYLFGIETNLPDLTALDLLKLYSALNVTPLYIKDGAVSFFDWKFEYVGDIEYEHGVYQLISHDETYYQVGDLARKNIIEFKDDDERNTAISLDVDNVSLDEESTFAEADMNRGVRGSSYVGNYYKLNIPNALSSNNDEYDYTNELTIAGIRMNTDVYLSFIDRVGITNNLLADIFDFKTKIVITVFMRFEQFNAIKFNSYVRFRGFNWCVLSIDWSENIGEMTLQRLSDSIT